MSRRFRSCTPPRACNVHDEAAVSGCERDMSNKEIRVEVMLQEDR
jgi:hypothetical protein